MHVNIMYCILLMMHRCPQHEEKPVDSVFLKPSAFFFFFQILLLDESHKNMSGSHSFSKSKERFRFCIMC